MHSTNHSTNLIASTLHVWSPLSLCVHGTLDGMNVLINAIHMISLLPWKGGVLGRFLFTTPIFVTVQSKWMMAKYCDVRNPPTLLIYLQVKWIYKTSFGLLFEFKRLRFPILHYQPLNLVLLGDSTLRRELLLSAFVLNINQIKFNSIYKGVCGHAMIFYKTFWMLSLMAGSYRFVWKNVLT